jgi:hypothetical protein
VPKNATNKSVAGEGRGIAVVPGLSYAFGLDTLAKNFPKHNFSLVAVRGCNTLFMNATEHCRPAAVLCGALPSNFETSFFTMIEASASVLNYTAVDVLSNHRRAFGDERVAISLENRRKENT